MRSLEGLAPFSTAKQAVCVVKTHSVTEYIYRGSLFEIGA